MKKFQKILLIQILKREPMTIYKMMNKVYIKIITKSKKQMIKK